VAIAPLYWSNSLPAEFAAHIENGAKKCRDVVQRAGAKLD
jgi:hypothetical protein